MAYPPNLSDEELMRSYVTGDSLAFEKLFQRLSPKVYGFLRSRLQNQEDIDEIFQKIFMKFHASRTSYDPKYPVLQWLFVITKSALLDHLKSGKRKEKLKEKASLSQNDPAPSLSNCMDETMLQTLSPEAQEVVKLRVIDELDFAEIALRLGKNEVSLRKILSRSLRKLKINFGASE